MKLQMLFMALATCLVMVPSQGGTTDAAERWPSISSDKVSVQRIRKALDEPTQIEFIETPLDQVVHFIQDQHDIPVLLDTRAMDAVGIAHDAPITISIRGISLRSGLRLLLRGRNLEFAVVDEVLLITVPQVAATQTEVRVYNVADLIDEDTDADALAATVAAVLNAQAGHPTGGGMGAGIGGGMFSVQTQMGGGGYGGEGGYGTGGFGPARPRTAPVVPAPLRIVPFKQLLIVRATDDGHRELAELLAALGKALGPEPPQP
jgi:hypothetical protein